MLLSFLVMIGLMGSVFIVTSYFRISDSLNSGIEKHGLDVVNTFGKLAAPYIFESDYISINLISQQLVDEGEINQITILDTEGKVWTSTLANPQEYFTGSPVFNNIENQEFSTHRRIERTGYKAIEFTGTIKALGEIS